MAKLTVTLSDPIVLNTCTEHGFRVVVSYIGSACPMCLLKTEHDHLVALRQGIVSLSEKLAAEVLQ